MPTTSWPARTETSGSWTRRRMRSAASRSTARPTRRSPSRRPPPDSTASSRAPTGISGSPSPRSPRSAASRFREPSWSSRSRRRSSTFSWFVNGEGTIAAGPDGNLWISGSGQMAKVTPQGAVTVLSVALAAGRRSVRDRQVRRRPGREPLVPEQRPHRRRVRQSSGEGHDGGRWRRSTGFFGQYFDILSAPDGNLWISAQGASPPESLTRVPTAGVETVYTLPTTGVTPRRRRRRQHLVHRAQHGGQSLADDSLQRHRRRPRHLQQRAHHDELSRRHHRRQLAGRSRRHSPGGATPSCPAGEAFYVGTSAEYGRT